MHNKNPSVSHQHTKSLQLLSDENILDSFDGLEMNIIFPPGFQIHLSDDTVYTLW